MHKRTKKLRALMAQHELDYKQVAEMLGRSETTVSIWACKNDGRVIPQMALDLLALKLAK